MEGKIFTFKADYAESTSTHNTANSNYEYLLYGDIKTPAQEENDKVRTTIFGKPCLIFHRVDSSSTPEFLGKYNYNWDKGTENVFGFTEDYPDVQSWEFLNNTSDSCLFHGKISDSWGDDFEARYPDGCEDISTFKKMHDWVVSTYQDGATGNSLSSTYTGIDGQTYTKDTAQYRLAKFKKEFTEYFDFDFALLYYVYTFVMLMVDQRAKNMFLTSWDKIHWQPWFYDQDTCLGINNEGVLVFNPFMEDQDKLDTANVYNGATSTLWVNFKESFPDEIQSLYKDLRSSGKLSYENIIEYFINRQSDKWSISIYNEDSDFKYISMLRSDNDSTNLYQVRGTGEEHLKYFATNRLMYCDSKWNSGDYPNDYVSLRIYTPSGILAVPANADITMTTFSDCYQGVKYRANGTLQQQRVKANVSTTFEAPKETFNDTETACFPASQISSLGDLSPLYCGSLNVSKAQKLTELIVGSSVEGYSNPNLTDVSIGTNKLLKKIDVRNCPNLTEPLALSNCPNIEEIYATGSGITGLELSSSGFLKKVYLPDTLTNLTVTNQQYIEEFQLDGYDALTTLRIEKTVNIPVEDIMLNAPNLNRVRLLDVSWAAESEEHLKQTIEKFKSCLGLDANGNNTDKAIVTGRVTVPSISDELFNDIYENFPDLVVDDGSGKPYIINYKDRDGKSLYLVRLAEGEDAYDPIEKGYIDTPPAIETENYKYFFIGWSTIPTNVNKHYVVTAQYKYSYAVKFYTDDSYSTLLYTQWVDYGENATDPVANGDIEIPIMNGTNENHRYTFTNWNNLPTNVTSTVKVYAIYTDTWAVRFYNDSVLVNTQWVIDSRSAVDPITAGYITTPTRASTAQYNYTFSGWDGTYTNVTEPVNITAQYSSTIRTYNVYFYNDTELLQAVENVQYGSSASYTGSTPTKLGVDNPEEYVFKGWVPAAENITGETKCYALFKFTGYLFGKLGEGSDYGTVDAPNWNMINAYWDTINSDIETMSEDELFAKYPIGGRMIIPVNLSSGTITADVEIIGHNHDNLADGSGKASLTFFCVDLPQILHRMNESSSNDGGYEASEMREFVNGELFTALPDKLKSIIKPVYKISDGGSNNKSLVTTTDSCWLASYDEVGLTSGANNLSGQGELYDSIFSSDKDSRKKYITDNAVTGGWWLRSSYYTNNNSSMFWRVTNSGGSYSDIAFISFYVAFGFCI